MGWTVQVVFQGAVIAGATLAAFYLPSNELRIAAAVFGIYFLVAIVRNPRFYLQRIVRFIVMATVPFMAVGISGRAGGTIVLPGGRGDITFEVVQGLGESVWAIVAILALCLALDGWLTWTEAKRRRKVFEAAAAGSKLFLKADGSVTFSTVLLVPGSSQGATVSGAKIRFAGVPSKSVDAVIYGPQEGKVPQKAASEVVIPPGKSVRITVAGSVPPGWFRHWLRFRAGWLPLRLIPLQTFAELAATPSDWQQPLPLSFDISPAPRR